MTNYKVITMFDYGEALIEHFYSLEYATGVYERAMKKQCSACYLLQTEETYNNSEDSVNTILKSYKTKNHEN